ncbi:helix-turn-helix domain-containing protein [Streptomyces odonnellii]|uniref:helix-turn-helix domain-containing protein n=1 Tax=Streptomyces odonnellii TaxID=1417980 RepID=UPI00062521DD
MTTPDGRPSPDGTVVLAVPHRHARELERILSIGLLAVYRADGGRPSPAAERLLRDLHAAARRPAPAPTADVGSEGPPAPRVELTVDEAAAVMGCRPRWIRTLLGSGRLRGRRVNARLWLIDADSFDEFRHGRSDHVRHETASEQG